MHERKYQLGNVDITIIAQQPKLSPHKEKMRDQLCYLLGSHPSTVNIKVSAIQLLAVVSLHFCCTLVIKEFQIKLAVKYLWQSYVGSNCFHLTKRSVRLTGVTGLFDTGQNTREGGQSW